MNDMRPSVRPVPAVGIVCIRGDEVLLIRRARPPKQGEWSIPGGRIECFEPAREAAMRELREETGVNAEIIGLIDVIDGLFEARGGEPARHYVLIDFLARWTSGEAKAESDAADARFVPLADLGRYDLWSETRRIIHKGAEIAHASNQE